MRDGRTSEERPGLGTPFAATRWPVLPVIIGVVAALVGMGVCAAAVLVPAPVAAVPFVVAICSGCPLLAGWEVASAAASRPADRVNRRALARLRSNLDRLPEIEHPLGL